MLYPSMSELLKKVDNRYMLVNLTAKRARDIAAMAEANETPLTEKPVKMALNDIMEGHIVLMEKTPEEENRQEEPSEAFSDGLSEEGAEGEQTAE